MKKLIIAGGYAEEGAVNQAMNCLEDAEAFILMADNHKGYGMPVGGVAVYKNAVSPAGVGFDIACGNKAVRLNLKALDIQMEDLSGLADRIFAELSFGVGRKNKDKVDHPLFDDLAWNIPFFMANPELKAKAMAQLGTIGSGNHYVDVFKDENDYVWIGVHFGSRGLGHTIASHYMKEAGDNVNIMDETPHLLSLDSQAGIDYWRAMELAGRYAYAGRDYVCSKVAEILGGEIEEEIHNHHNFAWIEEHNGDKYVVVRKGATPAFPNQKGFVGSTMAEQSVIIEGVDSEKSKEWFYSTVHGAGRVMSRTEAAGKSRFVKSWNCGQRDCDGSLPASISRGADGSNPKCPNCESKMIQRKEYKQISKGKVDWPCVLDMMKEKGIELRGAGADEAPQCYKTLDEVLALHEGTVKIIHRLTPLIICMAGSDDFDPYKD